MTPQPGDQYRSKEYGDIVTVVISDGKTVSATDGNSIWNGTPEAFEREFECKRQVRTVAWFSCGAASAVATHLVLADSPLVARCVVDNEHADNSRFARDASAWLGVNIIELKSTKYADCWQVWSERRWLNGPGGALCTVEMKKKVRQEFSQPGDIDVFGFTREEEQRAERFVKNNPEVTARFPLIEQNISKQGCYEIIMDAGLELPEMYRLGYHNANCVGCVKGGAGYWNKIRRDFPDVFARMAETEREVGASCINGQPLATLDPRAGRHSDLELPECGLFCGENE